MTRLKLWTIHSAAIVYATTRITECGTTTGVQGIYCRRTIEKIGRSTEPGSRHVGGNSYQAVLQSGSEFSMLQMLRIAFVGGHSRRAIPPITRVHDSFSGFFQRQPGRGVTPRRTVGDWMGSEAGLGSMPSSRSLLEAAMRGANILNMGCSGAVEERKKLRTRSRPLHGLGGSSFCRFHFKQFATRTSWQKQRMQQVEEGNRKY